MLPLITATTDKVLLESNPQHILRPTGRSHTARPPLRLGVGAVYDRSSGTAEEPTAPHTRDARTAAGGADGTNAEKLKR